MSAQAVTATSSEKLLLLLLARCYQLAPDKWVRAATLAEIADPRLSALAGEFHGLASSIQLRERDGAYRITSAGLWTAAHYRAPAVIEEELVQLAEKLVAA